jgi:hypothetical protein
MKLLLTAILAVVLVAIHPSAQGDPPPRLADLMRKKLEHAQKVLEGIAVNDFDKISRGGEELMLVSKTVEWRVFKTPEYEIHSNSFRRAAETLMEKAKDKNIDGAALAYVDLTLSCVKCHKYVRDTRMTRGDGKEVPSRGG